MIIHIFLFNYRYVYSRTKQKKYIEKKGTPNYNKHLNSSLCVVCYMCMTTYAILFQSSRGTVPHLCSLFFFSLIIKVVYKFMKCDLSFFNNDLEDKPVLPSFYEHLID